MKNKELQDLLKKYPDDMPVIYYPVSSNRILDCFGCAIVSKSHNDWATVLSLKFKDGNNCE